MGSVSFEECKAPTKPKTDCTVSAVRLVLLFLESEHVTLLQFLKPSHGGTTDVRHLARTVAFWLKRLRKFRMKSLQICRGASLVYSEVTDHSGVHGSDGEGNLIMAG